MILEKKNTTNRQTSKGQKQQFDRGALHGFKTSEFAVSVFKSEPPPSELTPQMEKHNTPPSEANTPPFF